jgi:enoyl-CoA hydratase/carnithine racemase
MIQAFKKQLDAWESDESIKAVVIQASPGKAFCAGGDIRGIYEKGLANKTNRESEDVLTFFHQEYALNHTIYQYSKPYISLMDGITMGGGVGISLHGNCPVAGPNFVFAMPETAIGFFPDIGASFLLSRLSNNIGLYLALTGARLNGEEAKSLNLVKFLLDPQSFSVVLASLLEIDLSYNTVDQIQALMSQLEGPTEAKPLENSEKIAFFFNERSLEEIMTKLAASDDPWAIDTLANLKQKSPLSLKVTFEQIQKARNMSLKECLDMDYSLVQHFMQGHDFYEGVRAAIIDKDKMPKWQPNSLDMVSDEMVARYFNAR